MPLWALSTFLPHSQDAITPLIISFMLVILCHIALALIFWYGVDNSLNPSSPTTILPLEAPPLSDLSTHSHSSPTGPPPVIRAQHGQPVVEKVIRPVSTPFLCPEDAPEDQFTIRVEVGCDEYVVIAQLAGFLKKDM